MKRERRFVAMSMVVALLLAWASSAEALPAGILYGHVQYAEGEAAPKPEDLTLLAFIGDDDDWVHTAGAFNSPFGENEGYKVKDGKGYWVVNFANFPGVQPGMPFTVLLSTRDGFQAKVTGSVPGQLTEHDEEIVLQKQALPGLPQDFAAQRTDKGIRLTWKNSATESVRVFRTEFPSGAENGRGNGVYRRIAAGIKGAEFVDQDADPTKTYWYLLVAESDDGTLGLHSKEIRAAVDAESRAKGSTQRSSKDAKKDKSTPGGG